MGEGAGIINGEKKEDGLQGRLWKKESFISEILMVVRPGWKIEFED